MIKTEQRFLKTGILKLEPIFLLMQSSEKFNDEIYSDDQALYYTINDNNNKKLVELKGLSVANNNNNRNPFGEQFFRLYVDDKFTLLSSLMEFYSLIDVWSFTMDHTKQEHNIVIKFFSELMVQYIEKNKCWYSHTYSGLHQVFFLDILFEFDVYNDFQHFVDRNKIKELIKDDYFSFGLGNFFQNVPYPDKSIWEFKSYDIRYAEHKAEEERIKQSYLTDDDTIKADEDLTLKQRKEIFNYFPELMFADDGTGRDYQVTANVIDSNDSK